MIKLFDQKNLYLAEWDSQWRCLLAAVLHRHRSDLIDARCDVSYVSSFSNWTKPTIKNKNYGCAKCEMVITCMYIERERERGPLKPLSSLDLRLWKKECEFEVCICNILCCCCSWLSLCRESEREREEVKGEALVRWFLVFIFWGGVLAGGTSERELKFQAFIARVSFLFFLFVNFFV